MTIRAALPLEVTHPTSHSQAVIMMLASRTPNVSVDQISAHSNNPRLSYSSLTIANLGDVCHLGFDRNGF